MTRLILFGFAVLLIACGGRETTASKSAAAYREAQAKGIAVGGGHEHGGHVVTTASTAPAQPSDPHAGHAAAPAVDHAAMGHAAKGSAAMDHAAMGHAPKGPAAMDHAGMDHGKAAAPHAAAGHAAPSASVADAHAQHGAPSQPAAHAQHGAATPVSATMTIETPKSNAEIARTEPASTLRQDAFDAPVPASVSEAAKAGTPSAHEGHKP